MRGVSIIMRLARALVSSIVRPTEASHEAMARLGIGSIIAERGKTTPITLKCWEVQRMFTANLSRVANIYNLAAYRTTSKGGAG